MSTTPTTADVLILGGGHAGQSAALTLYRQRHTCLIFDSDRPRNQWPTRVHATSSWEGRSAAELREASRRELESTGLVHFVEAVIVGVERQGGDCFRLTDDRQRSWVGRKLLLALGKKHEFPTIPGYADNYASRIFHCMFTFGYEQRGKTRAALLASDALANPPHTAMVVDDTAKQVERVTVYTMGRLAELAGMEAVLAPTGAVIDDRQIVALEAGGGHADGDSSVTVRFADGSSVVEDFLVHQPRTVVDHGLVIGQLGLDLDERGDIVVRWPFYHTKVPGVFAAGDCASPFKIIPNAMLMGANAGAGIARELPRRVTSKPVVWTQA